MQGLKISKNVSGKLLFGLLSADGTATALLQGSKATNKLFHKLFFILKYKDKRQIFMVLVTAKTQDNPL